MVEIPADQKSSPLAPLCASTWKANYDLENNVKGLSAGASI